MKNTLVIVCVFCLVISLFPTCSSIQVSSSSSDRINQALPTVTELRRMGSIVGWSQWSNGQWNSRNRLIPEERPLMGVRGIDNIQSLRLFSVIFDNQKYILFQKESVVSAYRYPNIREGYYRYNTYYHYLIKEENFQILLSSNVITENNLPIYRYFSIRKNEYHRNRLPEVLFSVISNPTTINLLYSDLRRPRPLQIPTLYNEKDGVVRFLLDTRIDNVSLSTYYFETRFDVFNRFFEPTLN